MVKCQSTCLSCKSVICCGVKLNFIAILLLTMDIVEKQLYRIPDIHFNLY